jgi:hypothetical protein
MSSTHQVEGTWKLDRFEIESKEGVRRAWGANAHGLLIYSPSGHMSVSINKDVVRESGNETEDLFDSILFYAGSYQIEGTLIRHQVTQASNPSRIGKEMLRYAEFEGDRVTLTTPVESFGRAILVWHRI